MRLPTTTWCPAPINDLANVLMGWLFGSSIALYRQIHWQHHRALGTTMDSENSYFDALGRRLSRRRHSRVSRRCGPFASTGDRGVGRQRPLVTGEPARLAHSLHRRQPRDHRLLWLFDLPRPPCAWPAGLLVVFPFVASLRQSSNTVRSPPTGSRLPRGESRAANRLFGTARSRTPSGAPDSTVTPSTTGSLSSRTRGWPTWRPFPAHRRGAAGPGAADQLRGDLPAAARALTPIRPPSSCRVCGSSLV